MPAFLTKETQIIITFLLVLTSPSPSTICNRGPSTITITSCFAWSECPFQTSLSLSRFASFHFSQPIAKQSFLGTHMIMLLFPSLKALPGCLWLKSQIQIFHYAAQTCVFVIWHIHTPPLTYVGFCNGAHVEAHLREYAVLLHLMDSGDEALMKITLSF